MKDFILIDHEPWTLRRKQLFYNLLKKAGIQIKVWDLSQWLYPNFTNPDELPEESYLTRIYSIEQYRNLLNGITPENTVIIEEVFRNRWSNRLVFKELAKRNIQTIKIELYGNTVIRRTRISDVFHLPIYRLPNVILNRTLLFILKLYNKYYNIKYPKLIFSSNSILPLTNPINHPDYEEFKFKRHEKLINGDYIVFCDIYFPYHSDLNFFRNLKKLPNAVKYHDTMCRYFDDLEARYKMPVVIAAHPKSNYSGNEFGKRKIIKYHTSDLVYYASAVTMHLCNSVSFALLGNKPLAFVLTDDYCLIPNAKHNLKILAEDTLGLEIYNLDHVSGDSIKLNRVSEDKRNIYIYNFLTSQITQDVMNEDTLSKALSNL